MRTLNQRGMINVLLMPLILVIVLFLGAAGFGVWAFMSRADYKDNSDRKAAVAAAQQKEKTEQVEAAKYAEEAKKPYDTYIGPAAYGNITVNYPKTWSGYIIEPKQGGGTPVSAYFQPKLVPHVSDQANNFALRVELQQTTYQNALQQFKSPIDQGLATIQPYSLPKVPQVVGSRIEGQINARKQGTMILLPLRNMTLKIWTESTDFRPDLDTHILPNLTFVP